MMRAREKRRIWEEARGHLGCGDNARREQGRSAHQGGKDSVTGEWACQDGSIAGDGGSGGDGKEATGTRTQVLVWAALLEV